MIDTHPYFFTFSFIVLAGLFFSLPMFSFLDCDNEGAKNKNVSIDSVRYFLASFVFISHSLRMVDFIKNGTWRSGIDEINFLAVMGVSIFFAITSILFWGRIGDRSINLLKLYINRFFRIVPLIWFNSIVVILLASLIAGDLPGSNVAYWFDPINNYRPDFNSFLNASRLTGGVFWTITYEWWFYFLIPVMCLFRKIKLITSVSLFILVYLVDEVFETPLKLGVIYPFIIGMVAHDLSRAISLKKIYLDLLASVSFVLLLLLTPKLHVVNSTSNILMLIFIFCLASRSDLFGALRIRGFKRLGDASYSIYAMHPIILFVIYYLAQKIGFLDKYRIATLLFSYILILALSLVTHKYIEKYFINVGKIVLSRSVSKTGDHS